jgi:hypothetical protein
MSSGEAMRLRRLRGSSLLAILFVVPLAMLLPLGILVHVVEHWARPLDLAFGSLVLGADAAAVVSVLVLLGTFADKGARGLRATPRYLWILCIVGVALTFLGCLAWLLDRMDYGFGPPLNMVSANVLGVFPLVVYGFLMWPYYLNLSPD